MAKYTYIPTGVVVESERELPSALYKPVEAAPKAANSPSKAAPKKAAPKRRTTKKEA